MRDSEAMCSTMPGSEPEEHKYQNLYILASEDLVTFVIVWFKCIKNHFILQINSYRYPPIHQDIQIQKMILELLQVRSRLAETSSQLDTARREVVTLRETLEEYRSQLQHYNVKQTQTSPVIDRRRERERGVKNIAFWCKIGLRQFPLSSAQLFPAIPCSL